MANQASTKAKVPRIAIEFCTQCKWNLRAAYYAQELLQTFSTSIGEIALIPVTGGTFTITMTHVVSTSRDATSQAAPSLDAPLNAPLNVLGTVIWDRKIDGGFPETKELKNRVRNIIEPGRDLGHIDRSLKTGNRQQVETKQDKKIESKQGADVRAEQKDKKDCEDCK